MRVLVAGRNAKVLATAAGTFANDLMIDTAATKAASVALLQRHEFDLIIACETLADGGSGLEVLSHVAVNTPNTLRIFAARPSTLKLLKGELGLFGLFQTLPYPINFRKLWASLNLARSCQVEGGEPRAKKPVIRHVVLDSDWRPGPAATPGASTSARASTNLAAQPRANMGARPSAPAAARTGASAGAQRDTPTFAGARPTAATSANARARPSTPTTTTPPRRATGAAAHTPPGNTRIPQSDAFRRALAKRNAAKLDANTDISAANLYRAGQQADGPGNRGGRRREPGVTNESLAQLARLTTTRRSTYDLKGAIGGRNRAALFVGSGVFAAATAAVLTFFMLNANNSIGRTSLPLVASIDRPVPHNVLPWQPQQPIHQQPRRTTFIQNEGAAPAATDLEVEAEAQSDASEIEPGHPGPPPPSTPPGPAEPPAVDYTGMPPEE